MTIDIHTHIYDEKSYELYFSKSHGRVDKLLVLHWYKDNLNKLQEFVSSKSNLYLVGSVDMTGDIDNQLKINDKLFRENKIFGIKLYPGYQYFYPSDETVFQVAELCQKYNKPLIFHSGDVYDTDGNALLKYAHPIYIDELAVKYPECKIIISHFGFPYLLETANIVYKNKNVYTDISGTLLFDGSYKIGDLKNIKRQYIDDLKRILNYFPEIKNKIMFGTDFGDGDTPFNETDDHIGIVNKVFNKNERDSVFYQLAERLFFK